MVAAALICVGAVPTVQAATGGGNSANAQRCNQGGWHTYVQSDGQSFTQDGDCTAYAAQGGILKLPQTIKFASPIGAVNAVPLAVAQISQPYTPSATATSGLPVTFTLDATSTGCTLSPTGAVSFATDGLCVIDANQAGNGTWAPAPQAQQTVRVDSRETLDSLTEGQLTAIQNGVGLAPLDANAATTISGDISVHANLDQVQAIVVGVAASLGRTFTPSEAGITAKLAALDNEFTAETSVLQSLLNAINNTIGNPPATTTATTNEPSVQLVSISTTCLAAVVPPTVPSVACLVDIINTVVQQVGMRLQELKANSQSIDIGDMFESQLLANHLAALVTEAGVVVTAANDAISSQCRDCRG